MASEEETTARRDENAVMEHLVLIHSLANDITEHNYADKRLYILQTCIRLGDLLATSGRGGVAS